LLQKVWVPVSSAVDHSRSHRASRHFYKRVDKRVAQTGPWLAHAAVRKSRFSLTDFLPEV
jgi:hypothetical protein